MEKDQDSSSSGKIGRDRPRGPDRRVSTRIGPPPYQTNEGAVLVEADHRQHAARADLEAASTTDAGFLVDVLDELRRPALAAGQRD